MAMSVKVRRLPFTRRAFCLWIGELGGANMTSLAEADSKFGDVVRDAGGAIFGVERGPVVGSRQEEKLQIGTPDGFVKLAVLLNQPNIDAVLREKTGDLVRRAQQLRKSSRLIVPSRLMPAAPVGTRRTVL
jgi:hypothetical protein